jgi:hypothetical protein
LMSANLKVTPTSLVERDHIAYMEDIAKANWNFKDFEIKNLSQHCGY